MNKLKKISILSLILTISVLGITSTCTAQSYQEVTTITGSGTQTTNYFTIPSGEWKIDWTYTPSASGGTYAVFYFFVYPKGETAIYTDAVMKTGNNDTSGTEFIHQGNNQYYLKINAANIDSYTITIKAEETSPSPTVPEFPASLTILLLVALVTTGLIILNKKTPTVPNKLV
jgi:hypothetical protein